MRRAFSLPQRALFTLAAGAFSVGLAGAAFAAPLADAPRQALSSMREDPAPAALVRNSHYWVSNENAHDVWRSHIANTGGALIGVGTDQVYILASWARPEVIIPMDFDASIRDIHFAYGAAFLESPDLATFRTFWVPEGEAKMREALAKHFSEARATAAMTAWRQGAPTIQRRFRKLVTYYNGKNIPTFINDEATYGQIRTLWQEGRVFPMRGDATGSTGMREIARALERANLKVGVVYLSNVEQYITYDAQTRRNFISLPWADNGWLLRTRPMQVLGLTTEDCEYHYNMQRGLNFRQWLTVNRVADGGRLLLRHRSRTATQGLSIVDSEPPVSTPAPEIAAP